MEKLYCKLENSIPLLLACSVLSMLLFIIVMTSAYVKLTLAVPLENFNGKLTDVELSQTHVTTAIGTYDRAVTCNIIDFKLFMHHRESGDIMVMTKSHLTKVPAQHSPPGKGIPLHFEIKLPSKIQRGSYVPTYLGTYVCKHGIFTQVKQQTIISPIMYIR